MKRIMLAAALLLATAVQAEETMFYERPAFMAETMPQKIECTMSNPEMGHCLGTYGKPNVVSVKVSTPQGQNVRVARVSAVQQILCQGGMCANTDTQAPAGDVVVKSAFMGNGTFFIVENYYLFQEENGAVNAYKRGFGPQGDKYPPYAIYTEPNPASITARDSAADEVVKLNNPENQTYGNAEVWPVWCEAGKSTCNVAGQAKDKDALFKEMPMASWGYCQGDFCYGDESLTDVIGLNPAIHN